MNTPARRNDKSTRGWKSYVLGATAAAALLATTACHPGAAEGSDGSRPSASPSGTASAAPGGATSDAGGESAVPGGGPTGGTGTAGGGGTTGGGTKGGTSAGSGGGRTGGTGTGGSKGSKGGTGSGGGTVAACTQKELGVSAVKERDNRHLVLTVQNASDKKCDLYGYPVVTLGADAQFTTPVIKDSDGTPGVPVTLDPGREAYAALLVGSGNTGGYEAKSITLSLQGGKPGSSVGKPIDVPMPVSTLHADNSQLVTYWTTASGFALRFIMSK